jgi:hypothetical protein
MRERYLLDGIRSASPDLTTFRPGSTPVEIEQLEQMAAGHVLAKAELTGRYGRSKLVLPRFW